MIISNTVLRLNIKGQGGSLVWLFSDPVIEASQVGRLLPAVPVRVYGSNLTYVCRRIAKKTFFLATTSTWNARDEYGRQGIDLSQGVIITGDHSGPDETTSICNYFAVLLRIHRTRYQTLGEILDHLASEGNEEKARQIAAETFDTLNNFKSECTKQPVQALADYLKILVSKQNIRLRVDTRFPWSEELGFFALIGVLTLTEDVTDVGGGQIIPSGSYQHIATPLEVPGFKYEDLNKLLTTGVQTNSKSENRRGEKVHSHSSYKSSLFGSAHEGEEPIGVANTSWSTTLWDKLSWLNTPLFSVIVILSLGIVLIYQQNELVKKRGVPTEELRKQPPSATHVQPLETPSPADSILQPVPSQDDPGVTQAIAQLYAPDPDTRGRAILKLRQDKPSHEKMVPLALKYAFAHPTEKDGVVNTFLVFQKCDPVTLKKNKDDIARFIDLVKKVDGTKAPDAERMKAVISQP